MRAFHEVTGKEVHIGDEVTNFRGDKGKLVGLERIRVPGRSGKVAVDTGGEILSYNYDKVWSLIVTDDAGTIIPGA